MNSRGKDEFVRDCICTRSHLHNTEWREESKYLCPLMWALQDVLLHHELKKETLFLGMNLKVRYLCLKQAKYVAVFAGCVSKSLYRASQESLGMLATD